MNREPTSTSAAGSTATGRLAAGLILVVALLGAIGAACGVFLRGDLATTPFTTARAELVDIVAGGLLLSQMMKWGFDRPRPDLVPHGSYIYTKSFPSGHTMLAAVVYLTLGALLARTQPQVRVKVFLLVLAGFLTVLIGVAPGWLIDMIHTTMTGLGN